MMTDEEILKLKFIAEQEYLAESKRLLSAARQPMNVLTEETKLVDFMENYTRAKRISIKKELMSKLEDAMADEPVTFTSPEEKIRYEENKKKVAQFDADLKARAASMEEATLPAPPKSTTEIMVITTEWIANYSRMNMRLWVVGYAIPLESKSVEPENIIDTMLDWSNKYPNPICKVSHHVGVRRCLR